MIADVFVADSDGLPEPRSESRRQLGVAWRNSYLRSIAPIGVLSFDDDSYWFRYVATAGTLDGFRPLLGFPELLKTYRSNRLFPYFRQRIMDRRRPDYEEYLSSLRLPQDASDLDVLARSGGFRKGDTVQIVEEPAVDSNGGVEYDFLVRGVRFATAEDAARQALENLRDGDALRLVQQPDNPANPKALSVVNMGGHPLGWFPDLLVDFAARVWASPGPSLSVLQANGGAAPDHLRVVARLAGRLPGGYQLLSGPRWRVSA